MNALSEAGRPKLEVGEIIAGKFRIERMIGSGGTGLVALATHLQLDERVALKFLHGSSAPERLAEEARACLRLKTEHVAKVKDLGRHRDMPFLVMEYLEGKDLQALLEENGKLEDATEAVELVVQVCEAVAEAHRAKIVHRDIKLSNLFFVASRSSVPLVKLLDFGISSSVSSGTTKTLGTLHYMAPEALQGGDLDRRSDIWSLGVVLFELLTGWKPFGSKDVVSLVVEIQHDPHISLRSLRPDLALELEAIIDRCMEKDPENRFQTAGELAVALLPFSPLRARANIERAVSSSEDVPPPPSLDESGPGSEKQSSIRALRSSTGMMKTTGSPRSSTLSGGSSTLRGSRSASSMSLGRPQRSVNLLVWAVAACAVIGLVAVLTFRRTEAPAASTAGAPSPAKTELPPPAAPPPPAVVAIPSVTAPSPVATTAAPPVRAVPPAAVGPAAWVRRPATAGVGAAPAASTSPPPPATTPAKGLEKDPWHSSKPKLEDSPFK